MIIIFQADQELIRASWEIYLCVSNIHVQILQVEYMAIYNYLHLDNMWILMPLVLFYPRLDNCLRSSPQFSCSNG
jgi:hypothetical protein